MIDLDNISHVARFAMVHISIMLLVILQAHHWGGGIFLLFGLMGLYYWGVHRPTLIPLWSWAIYGLFLDSITGLPLGLTSLFLIIADLTIKSQRRLLIAQPYFVFWLGFAVLAILYEVWRLTCFLIITSSIPAMNGLFIEAGLSIILFPLINIVLILTHRLLPLSQSRS